MWEAPAFVGGASAPMVCQQLGAEAPPAVAAPDLTQRRTSRRSPLTSDMSLFFAEEGGLAVQVIVGQALCRKFSRKNGSLVAESYSILGYS